MNEVLKKKDSAYAGGFRKPEEAIRLISERMLTHRPRVELSLHPYFKQEHMALRPISQMEPGPWRTGTAKQCLQSPAMPKSG